MAMNKILPTILLWLRLNPGKEPREFKAPKTEEERVEQKVSRCLRHLRGKAELGKLPNDVDDQLTKVRLEAPCSEGGAGERLDAGVCIRSSGVSVVGASRPSIQDFYVSEKLNWIGRSSQRGKRRAGG